MKTELTGKICYRPFRVRGRKEKALAGPFKVVSTKFHFGRTDLLLQSIDDPKDTFWTWEEKVQWSDKS